MASPNNFLGSHEFTSYIVASGTSECGKGGKGKADTGGWVGKGRGAGVSIPKLEIGGPGERTLTALQRDGPCRCSGRDQAWSCGTAADFRFLCAWGLERGRSGDLLACSVERHPRLLVRVTTYTSVQRIPFIEFSSKNLVHQYLSRGGSKMFILTGVK